MVQDLRDILAYSDLFMGKEINSRPKSSDLPNVLQIINSDDRAKTSVYNSKGSNVCCIFSPG